MVRIFAAALASLTLLSDQAPGHVWAQSSFVNWETPHVHPLEATPDGHNELGKFTALRGKAWNPFAFAAPYLLVRNDEEAALWKLPLAG